MSGLHDFETPGSVSLQIRLPSGRVVVTTADEPRTIVELVPLGRRGADALNEIEVRLDERRGGHVVTVEQTARFRLGPIQISWDDAIEVRVTCPRGASLELASASADLRVDGELGDVSVKTASGDVDLAVVAGALEVKSASGDVSVATVGSTASLTTISGEIHVGVLQGALTARAVSGDVRVRSVRARLSLSTTSGDIELDAVESGEVRVQTISGDARIAVARGTRVWIDAASVSGDLHSELGVADEPDGQGADGPAPVVPLHVKTVSGDVAIVRAAERASA